MTICRQCFVFQELCKEVVPERENVESLNIIFNNFVDHKPEENETLIATAKEDKKSLATNNSKFQDGIKLLEMYIISQLKL